MTVALSPWPALAHALLASVGEWMPPPDHRPRGPRLAGSSPATPPPAGWSRAGARRAAEALLPVLPGEMFPRLWGPNRRAELVRPEVIRAVAGVWQGYREEMTSNITLEQHLETCTECREGSRCAPRTPELPAEVPPEVLLDGPPDDADLLLQHLHGSD